MVSGELGEIRALTFDTGGTILDWHGGFCAAFASAGQRHGLQRDWAALSNELRRRSLAAMLNQGEQSPPSLNFDEAHRQTLAALIEEEGLQVFTAEDRQAIAFDAPHRFQCWPDVPAALARLRQDYIVVSFTALSYRLAIDTARRNGLSWDAVFSGEGMGKYKLLPEAYRMVADYLQLEPAQCCMVACHGFDLDAARTVDFRTAFVRRPREWGPSVPAAAVAEDAYDIVVDGFAELADRLSGG